MTAGRRLIIAGAVLLTVAVLGGGVGLVVSSATVPSSDDVDVDGSTSTAIPGSIDFTVPGGESGGSMQVGLGVTYDVYDGYPRPDCAIKDGSGSPVSLDDSSDVDLVNDPDYQFGVIGTADLEPGRYTASCGAGEPAASSASSGGFTVSRLADDLTDAQAAGSSRRRASAGWGSSSARSCCWSGW